MLAVFVVDIQNNESTRDFTGGDGYAGIRPPDY
jgi:hypothetical protein